MTSVSFTAGTGSRRFELTQGKQVVIGRSEKADLYVNSPRLSRMHCAVRQTERGLVLQDLGSANGTFVNGQRVQQAALRPGDIVQVGGVAIRVEFEAKDAPTQDMRCERCRRLVSMARCEEGQVFELGERFLCPECAVIEQHEALNQTEQQMVESLRDEGLVVEGKTPLSTPIVPVFKARRLDLDTIVAVKALPLVAGISQKKVARFQSEARAAARVRHPNVIEIYDIRQTKRCLYILMEYVEGEVLLDRVQRSGPLPLEQVLRVGLGVARALKVAHEQGIVHRDVKPAGIVITPEGRPKMADFGLAKDLWAITSHLTGPEETLGTVRYMPPEQVKNARSADHRADVYGVGATLYHLLNGAPPYSDRPELVLMGQVLAGTLPPFDPNPPRCPPRMTAILRRCMAPDPEARYQSAAELERDLGAVVQELAGVGAFPGDPELLLALPLRAGAGDEVTWKAMPAPKPGGFSGTFHGDELLELLRMLATNLRTGLLTAHSQQRSGHLALIQGRLRAAVTNGGQRGLEAALTLCQLSSGQFEFSPELPPSLPKELDLDVEALLLEAARRKDESRAPRGR